MTNISTEIELIEAHALAIDTSSIDVSEVESADDQDFLRQHGAEILRIDAKADAAIKQIVATIQGRANLAKGKEVAEIQDRFEGRKTGNLTKFYASLGVHTNTAYIWANAYRAAQEFGTLFDGLIDPAKVLECSDTALAKIQTLPTEYREQVLAEVAAGDTPTTQEVTELAKKPEVKLSKAEELLAAAKARKAAAEERLEEVKADPNFSSTVDGKRNLEYHEVHNAARDANISVAKFEQQIADLQAEVEQEKLRTAQEHEEKARLETELQKLKFDDATARAERIKRISNNLTLSVPQTLADVQKFFTEKDEYPEKVRHHLVEQMTYLANYIGDQL